MENYLKIYFNGLLISTERGKALNSDGKLIVWPLDSMSEDSAEMLADEINYKLNCDYVRLDNGDYQWINDSEIADNIVRSDTVK